MREIPRAEFAERIRRVQEDIQGRDLDALFVFSTESEPANVRYFSDYWPSFETAGVLIPAEGEPFLLIGPESLTYARVRSKIAAIRRILEFRESSEPEYPGAKLDTFASVLEEASAGRGIRRLGLAGTMIMTVPVYLDLKEALKDGSMVKADDLVINLRVIKSQNEIALHRQAYRLAEKGLEAVLRAIKPGMTEIQILAEAEYAMLSQGAEDIGYTLWCSSGPNTNQAISRPTHRRVQKGELIQLQIGARVGGYSSSVARPCVIGKVPVEVKALLEVGLRAAEETRQAMRPGAKASEVARRVAEFITAAGYGDYILYGPAHGTGLMECEHPFVETTSEVVLRANMVFSVDTWLANPQMGIRFEDGIGITEEGIEEFSNLHRDILSL